LHSELEREAKRLALVEQQIEDLEARRREHLSSPRTEAERRIVHLMRLGAIGPSSAWLREVEGFHARVVQHERGAVGRFKFLIRSDCVRVSRGS